MEGHVLLPDTCGHTRAEIGCSFRQALVPLRADSLQGPGTIQPSLHAITHRTSKIGTARGGLQFGETQLLFCLHRVNSTCTVQGLVIELSFFLLLRML